MVFVQYLNCVSASFPLAAAEIITTLRFLCIFFYLLHILEIHTQKIVACGFLVCHFCIVDILTLSLFTTLKSVDKKIPSNPTCLQKWLGVAYRYYNRSKNKLRNELKGEKSYYNVPPVIIILEKLLFPVFFSNSR